MAVRVICRNVRAEARADTPKWRTTPRSGGRTPIHRAMAPSNQKPAHRGCPGVPRTCDAPRLGGASMYVLIRETQTYTAALTELSSSFPLPPLERLPSGRHRLTREAVVESQRGRLVYAIAQVVAEKGYAAATVADVVDRASVSRSTFYDQFPDKETCFLAAFNEGAEFVLNRMHSAANSLGPARDW